MGAVRGGGNAKNAMDGVVRIGGKMSGTGDIVSRTVQPAPAHSFLRRLSQWQLVRFVLVGGAATLTHLVVALAILSGPVRVEPLYANLAAFCVAFGVSYLGHRFFTFKAPGAPIRFLLAALLGLLVNNAVLVTILAAGMSERLAIGIAALAAPAIVFLVSKFWVFSRPA
jgi:putative flippase GtrA